MDDNATHYEDKTQKDLWIGLRIRGKKMNIDEVMAIETHTYWRLSIVRYD